MKESIKQQKEQERRLSLMEQAMGVLAREPGMSLEQIAKAIGVGRATLHRHFKSRDGLISAISMLAIEQTDHAVAEGVDWGAGAGEQFLQMLEAVVGLGSRYHFLSYESHWSCSPEVQAGLDRQMAGLREMVEGLKDAGLVGLDVPSAWVVGSVNALIYAAWIEVEGGGVARNDAARLIYRTVLKGLGAG